MPRLVGRNRAVVARVSGVGNGRVSGQEEKRHCGEETLVRVHGNYGGKEKQKTPAQIYTLKQNTRNIEDNPSKPVARGVASPRQRKTAIGRQMHS